MIAYPDTSFLCAIYRQQDNSREAAACFKSMAEPLHVTSLLLYEFRQSLRFQVWLHGQRPQHGFSETVCNTVLTQLRADLETGALLIVTADWAELHRIAERLSAAHTKTNGHRAIDILHVATALHLGAQEFLTFDENQRQLAAVERLRVRP